MNLREVRQAAEYVQGIIAGWEHHPSLAPELCEIVDAWRSKLLMQSTHILTTIDPSPEAAITAEWLREEWGGNITQHGVTIFAKDIGRECLLFDTPKGWEVSGEDDYYWPIHLTTRQQFTDLARCLGIPRRQTKSEPGCTCLDSPNMLYAPCSYCEQLRKDGAK